MSRFINTLQEEIADPCLLELLASLLTTTATIAGRVGQGALGDLLGATVQQNVQGEVQKKLDVIANDVLIEALKEQRAVRAIASEEEEHSLVATPGAPYLVAFDPLDGSNNIDINAQIGTIFTILPARDDVPDGSDAQFFQPGHRQVCAGYVLYGPYTTLVMTTGKTVHEATLDKVSGEFRLSRSPLRLPSGLREFSANMANLFYWPQKMQDHVTALIQPAAARERFNMRWQGAMVGDMHRVLTRGGIFIYPSDAKDPAQPARLRLLYEAFPMALLVEAAGGYGYSEGQRLLDITPVGLHQRTGVFLGEVTLVEDFLAAAS